MRAQRKKGKNTRCVKGNEFEIFGFLFVEKSCNSSAFLVVRRRFRRSVPSLQLLPKAVVATLSLTSSYVDALPAASSASLQMRAARDDVRDDSNGACQCRGLH